MAFIEGNPANDSGVMAASDPPTNMMSASPGETEARKKKKEQRKWKKTESVCLF